VTHGVDEALAALKPGLPDLDVDATIFRPASFVEMSIKNLSSSLLLGCPPRHAGPRPVPLRVARRR